MISRSNPTKEKKKNKNNIPKDNESCQKDVSTKPIKIINYFKMNIIFKNDRKQKKEPYNRLGKNSEMR